LKEKSVDIIGKSPVPVPVLLIGKIGFAGCSLFFIVKMMNVVTMLYDSDATRVVGAGLYAVGLAMVIISLVHLGQSAAVGIPERRTELKTHGLYRFTRNPIYLGGFLMCAGSCLFSIHPLNFLFFAIAVAVHVRIVIREEEFLEKRFGQEWLDYKRRVPRYIGRIRESENRLAGG
jgi:protein-S-isoprenylcysteine O-methyltransferase Ste14